MLDGLETADRLAELLADLRVVGGGVQRPARQPGCLGREDRRRQIDDALRGHRQPVAGAESSTTRASGREKSVALSGSTVTPSAAASTSTTGLRRAAAAPRPGRRPARSPRCRTPGRRRVQIGRQRDARRALTGGQRLEHVRLVEHQGGQRRRRDRAGHQGGGGLVDHRAEILDGAVRSAGLLGHRDTEDPQLREPVVGARQASGLPCSTSRPPRRRRTPRPSHGPVRGRRTVRRSIVADSVCS